MCGVLDNLRHPLCTHTSVSSSCSLQIRKPRMRGNTWPAHSCTTLPMDLDLNSCLNTCIWKSTLVRLGCCTKHHRQSGVNNRNLSLYVLKPRSSRCWPAQLLMMASLGSPPHYELTWPLLCMFRGRKPAFWGPLEGRQSTLRTILLKAEGPIIPSCWGSGFRHRN